MIFINQIRVEEVPRSSNQINLDNQLHPVVPSRNTNRYSQNMELYKGKGQTLKETM